MLSQVRSCVCVDIKPCVLCAALWLGFITIPFIREKSSWSLVFMKIKLLHGLAFSLHLVEPSLLQWWSRMVLILQLASTIGVRLFLLIEHFRCVFVGSCLPLTERMHLWRLQVLKSTIVFVSLEHCYRVNRLSKQSLKLCTLCLKRSSIFLHDIPQPKIIYRKRDIIVL